MVKKKDLIIGKKYYAKNQDKYVYYCGQLDSMKLVFEHIDFEGAKNVLIPDGWISKGNNTYWYLSEEQVFEIEDNFVLPTKWCIKVTEENNVILANWRTDTCKDLKQYIGYYLHTPYYDKNGYNNSYKMDGFTEITFEQFKKYVLKEETIDIKEKSNMFLKDDYIVFIECENSDDDSFPINYLFKQREDNSYLSPYLDNEGSKTNSWEYYRNFNNNFNGYKSKWRYGTPEEIAYYEKIGKPFDVTKLNTIESDNTNVAVHCTTQEQWDFVLSKFNPKNISKELYSIYNTKSILICRGENLGCYGSVGANSCYYKIISFEEWCKENNYTMEEEVLVFGKYHIGDIVVSLTDVNKYRKTGDIFKILPKSSKTALYYLYDTNSMDSDDWRAATEEEIQAFKNGITNINDMKPTFEVGKWYKYNGWYIKYLKHSDSGAWISSEEIDCDCKYRKTNNPYGGKNVDSNKILLTDLSEIQQYLPDGHPDKIVKPNELTLEQWIKNTKSLNLNIYELEDYINNDDTCPDYIYKQFEKLYPKEYDEGADSIAQILYDEWSTEKQAKPDNNSETFKAGDWIVITKSEHNWASGTDFMDKYNCKIVQLTSVDNNGDSARFNGDGGWIWNYCHGHFRKATKSEIKNHLGGKLDYSQYPLKPCPLKPLESIPVAIYFSDIDGIFNGDSDYKEVFKGNSLHREEKIDRLKVNINKNKLKKVITIKFN